VHDGSNTISDSFSFDVDDGQGNVLGGQSFALTITPVNDAPVAVDDSFSIPENIPFTAAQGVDDLLLNDSDSEGDFLTVNTTPVSGPSNGSLILNADGTFTYTPDLDFNGTDAFTYEISDGNGGMAQATVMITVNNVNQAPLLGGTSFTVDEDMNLTPALGVDDLLSNAVDPDGDPVTINTAPVSGPSNGSLVLNSDGTFTYIPDADFNGTDSFTYEVSDGNGGVTQALVTINVNPLNDAPVAIGDVGITDGDLPIQLTESSLLANDQDVDGDTLSIVAFSQPGVGSLVDNGNGVLTYTPAPGFTGTDAFTYTVVDSSGTQSTAVVLVVVNESTLFGGSDGSGGSTINDDSTTDDQGATDSGEDEQGNTAEDNSGVAARSGSDNPPVTLVLQSGGGGVALDGQGLVSASDRDSGIGHEFLAQKLGSGADPDTDRRTTVNAVAKYFYNGIEGLQRILNAGGLGGFEFTEIQQAQFWEALDSMKREMSGGDQSDDVGGPVVVQIATGMSLVVSAGFVSWLLRGGALAATLLSTMPMWKGFDPLPMLLVPKKRRKKDDDEDQPQGSDLHERTIERFFGDSGDWQDSIVSTRKPK